MKRMVILLITVVLILGVSLPVYAAGSVTYDAGADKFIFAPGSDESPTNLFANFQNVMPGDTLTEQIVLKNDKSNGVKIKLYVRSLGAQENTDDFLAQMKLTVKQAEKTALFDAPVNETAQLTDWVYLGTLYSGGETTLDVTLEVPITMGNDFQNSVGYLDWEFRAEELPVESGDPSVPQTGDNTPITLMGVMLLLSAAGIGALLVKKNRYVRG